jgi:transformer-2 protein
MSLYTTERDLKDFFGKFGPIENIQLVFDHPTGRSRGFGFIYFENIEDAIEAKEQGPGTELDGHRIRCDFSATKRAHTPTPGIYMGRSTRVNRRDDYYERDYRDDYGGRGGRRHRSRSYSPRGDYY